MTIGSRRTAPVWRKVVKRDWVLLTRPELNLLLLIGSIVLFALLWLFFEKIEPPPPKVVRITTGTKSGAYFQFGNQYAARMAHHGIKLEVMESSGSLENLQRLTDQKQRVDFALIQSGVSQGSQEIEIDSLASVAYEPVWVFYKPAAQPPERLASLIGKRISVGVQGGGARAAALELLKANGIDTSNSRLIDTGGTEAIESVQRGDLDAAIIVAAAAAPVVQQALDAKLAVLDFEQADAYSRRFAWLSKITLPRGSANLATNYPPQDIRLVATAANLVARRDTHPAISFLLLDIASEVHGKAGPLHGLKEFPNERNLEFEQSDESKRFFKTGRPFLQRYLPFWLANLVERFLVSAMPILMILIPALKLIPAFFDWRAHAEILQIYDEVHTLQQQFDGSPSKRAAALGRLEELEKSLPARQFGASKHIDVYNLKSHIDLARQQVNNYPVPK